MNVGHPRLDSDHGDSSRLKGTNQLPKIIAGVGGRFAAFCDDVEDDIRARRFLTAKLQATSLFVRDCTNRLGSPVLAAQ
jgi:hypothetical protein